MALNQESFEDIHCNMKNIRFYLPHYDIHQLSSNLQLTSLIPGRLPLYDMIRGYFDLKKIVLKALPQL